MRKKILITLGILLFAALVIKLAYPLLPGQVINGINGVRCKLLYSLGMLYSGEKYKNTAPSDIFHTRHVKPDVPLKQILRSKNLQADDNINIFVELASRTLYIRHGDTNLKQYRFSAGTKTSLGTKQKRDDYKTPAGEFYICSKVVYNPPKGYIGSRWMLLSYPDLGAAERGLENNLITADVYETIKKSAADKATPPQDTPLGSAIGIHGGASPDLPRDWTAGCVGMYDQDVEEIYDYVKVGTKVIIK